MDEAGILSPAARERVTARLEALEAERGAQVAVLTVPSLEREALEEYSLRVAETWALGRGGFDDGALLLIARDDRKMRLEVGYGLEGVLTDATSRRILDDVIRPRFRTGDFDGGIEEAVAAIDGLVRGEENVLPAPRGGRQGMPLAQRLFGGLLFVVVVGIFSIIAVGTGSRFLYLFLIPFWFAFPSAFLGPRLGVLAGVAWIVGFPILRLLVRRSGGGSGGSFWGGMSGGGWTWSSGRGSSSFGGFSGGFSGGGGSFGGGGASGGW
ncbi:MAG: TPM domain-containing protein [Thermoanaerobaculia bacterium]|nr:TPM domain-containing protein [Thermoanaerobaculia bacterium]